MLYGYKKYTIENRLYGYQKYTIKKHVGYTVIKNTNKKNLWRYTVIKNTHTKTGGVIRSSKIHNKKTGALYGYKKYTIENRLYGYQKYTIKKHVGYTVIKNTNKKNLWRYTVIKNTHTKTGGVIRSSKIHNKKTGALYGYKIYTIENRL